MLGVALSNGSGSGFLACAANSLFGLFRRSRPIRENEEPAHPEFAMRRAIGTYLAGFGLAGGDRHAVLNDTLIAGARLRYRETNQNCPIDCATYYVEQRFKAWLQAVLGREIATDDETLTIGRAAFLSCDGPTMWADLVLVEDGLPQSFVTAMRASAPAQVPARTPGQMPEQQLESWSPVHAQGAALQSLEMMVGSLSPARDFFDSRLKANRTTS